MVQQVSKEVIDGVHQALKKTQEEPSSMEKTKVIIMPYKDTPNLTTKCCYSCGEDGHISSDCSKKRDRFPVFVVKYEEDELRDLLALERPRKKYCNKPKDKDISQIICFDRKKPGHYATHCLEKPKNQGKEKVTKISMKKDKSHIMCFKCKKLGHYSNKCPEWNL